MDIRYTAWCGLNCMDCIPSNAAFFAQLQKLADALVKLQFEKYAELKSLSNGIFSEYPTFVRVLSAIKSLQCSAPCKEGGGKPDCEVKICAQSRGMKGCWECDDRPSCIRLDHLRHIHPNLDYHLDLINAHGPDNWHQMRRKHYRWQHEDAGE